MLTGRSVGIDSRYGDYPLSVIESVLPVIASSYTVDNFTSFLPAQDTTGEWAVSGRPLPREGAAYGCDGTLIYMAGGAYITSTSIIALRDVWVFNTTADAYVTTPTAMLPLGIYYSVSEWEPSQRTLYIFGGRTNTAGNAVTNTYSNALIGIDFTNPALPVITNRTLLYQQNRRVQGVQFASSALLDSSLFVWGGVAGANGSLTLPSQQFFAISLTTFTVSILPSTGLYDWSPLMVWISPALFPHGQSIYLYSGLYADYVTWSTPAKLYVYDTISMQWLEDVAVTLSPYTSLPTQWPNVAFAGRTFSTDGNHVLLIGGTEGDMSANGPGSHNKVVHVDLTALVSNSSGQPLVSVLPSRLLVPLQSAVVGLTANSRALFCFSGAGYSTTEIPYPVSYSSLMQELLQTGYESTGVYGPVVIANPTPVTVITSTSSATAVSAGQLAGIIIGSLLGVTALNVAIALIWTGKWRALVGSRLVTVSGRQIKGDVQPRYTPHRTIAAAVRRDNDEEEDEVDEDNERRAVDEDEGTGLELSHARHKGRSDVT